MFHSKNDYGQNKHSPDIIYTSATGTIHLSREDFESEADFLRWKQWSDQDYLTNTPREDALLRSDWNIFLSALDLPPNDQPERSLEQWQRIAYNQIKSNLTSVQYARWSLFLCGVKMTAIARIEGVSKQAVSRSIALAKRKSRKVVNKLLNFCENRLTKPV